MEEQSWNIQVRLLHWTIVLTVTFQLVTSLFMSDQGTQYLFVFHQVVGLLASLAVLVFWLYSFAVYDLPILFPWNGAGLRAVVEELKGLTRGRLPATGRRIGLSSFVHGLGLLALTGAAVTGTVMFTMVPPGHHGPPADPMAFTAYALKHNFFGVALFIYWAGHVTFALLHQLAGHNVIGAIFRLSDPAGSAGDDVASGRIR